jgi:hypothetical protein
MDIEGKNLIEVLNIILKDNGKNITSLEQLSDFNIISEIIKIM